MAITQTLLTSDESGTNGTSIATASITPSANKLILAAISGSSFDPGDNDAPTGEGTGLDWIPVATVITDSDFGRITVFRAMGSSPSSGAVTFLYPAEQTSFEWVISEFGNVDTSGTNGSGAVVQSATGQASSTTQTVTLAAFGSANNATFGAFGHDASNGTSFSATPGSGFTEIAEEIHLGSGFSDGIQTQWRVDNDTTVNITWSKTGELGGIAIEIKAAAVGVTIPIMHHHYTKNIGSR